MDDGGNSHFSTICHGRIFAATRVECNFYSDKGHKINNLNIVTAICCATLLLNGCGIGGFWMNGDPSAGKNLKPYIEEWEQPGATPEMRGRDSENCGGGDSNHAPLFTTAEIKAELRPGEKENSAYSRLHHNWQRCMLKKGYRYTGQCYSQSSPGCGAP